MCSTSFAGLCYRGAGFVANQLVGFLVLVEGFPFRSSLRLKL